MQKTINICKGLNIKMQGESSLNFIPFKTDNFALIPDNFRWIIPKLDVEDNDSVKIGTPIFHSKEDERIVFVSPVSGKIKKIIRGEKRKIERIEITSDSKFESINIDIPAAFDAETIKSALLKYGLWNNIRELPFNVIANPDKMPKAVFVSGFDTAPLAPDIPYLLNTESDFLQKGFDVIKQLTNVPVYLSQFVSNNNSVFAALKGVEFRFFKGKHPAGNIATQVHKISPVNKGETIWHIDLQSLIVIGKFFYSKKLDFSKKINICGQGLKNRGYVTIIQGACMENLIYNNTTEPNVRVISGNILTGNTIDINGYINYYHHQLTVIPEGGNRRLFGWMNPGINIWSHSKTYLSWLMPRKKYKFDTSLNGGVRPMMMNTLYDSIFPFDIFPVQLLKACIIEDVELMENLGIYEVTEEDFALCEVICPSKIEWQTIIYKGLTLLKE